MSVDGKKWFERVWGKGVVENWNTVNKCLPISLVVEATFFFFPFSAFFPFCGSPSTSRDGLGHA